MSSKKKNLDKISLLPDSVLLSILSLLNIRQVVQTCVLSKRWKTLWTDIPTLNFDFDSYPFEESISSNIPRNLKETSFMRFFFRVLSECYGTEIHNLSYSSTKPEDITDSVVQLLVCYARSHKVQQICFNTYDHVYYNWPSCLSECSSLTVLKMKCGFVDNWGDLKSFSLRILEIECDWEYRIEDKEYRGIKMFRDCPNLKSLVLINYLFQSACICAPRLENLELYCAPSQWRLSFPRIELLSPYLKSVKVSNVLPTFTSSYENSFIHKVHIEVENFNSQNWTTSFNELLRVFRNARCFILPLKAIEVLMLVPDSLSGFSLDNLRYLRLITKETKKMIVIDLPMTTLAFLQKCPNVKTLAIDSN